MDARPDRFDNISDNLRRLFSSPSLMQGEDPEVYAELYDRVEEVVQPENILDQLTVADITSHVWEQQRLRRYSGTVINSKRRAALERILHGAIGLNDLDTKAVADIYFAVTRLDETEIRDYSTHVRIPNTRAGVVDLIQKHGFTEADIDQIVMETSVEILADLENLAIKHEIRREANIRDLQRRRKKGNTELHRADPRLNGEVRALAKDQPEAPSPSPTEPPP